MLNSIEISEKIRRGEIDCNNQSLFFKDLTRGLLINLRKDISIRGDSVPHFIVNTGDETMALEAKGQDQSIEPLEVSNENYIYTTIPRCVVSPKGVNLQPDQLTSPYTKGQFQIESEDNVYTMIAEFRRMPLKMTYDLTYLMDSYTDTMELTQQIITKLSFVRMFYITYMGQRIGCSYVLPESYDEESVIDFDEASTDDRRHKINISIEVETNIPIYDPLTVMAADNYIKTIKTSNPLTGIDEFNIGLQSQFKVYGAGDIAKDGPWVDPKEHTKP